MRAPSAIALKTGLKWLIKNYKMSLTIDAVNYPLPIAGFKVDHQAKEMVWEVASLRETVDLPVRNISHDDLSIASFEASVVPESGAPHFKAACSIACHIPAEKSEDLFVVFFHEKGDYQKLFTLSNLLQDTVILEKMNGVDGCRIGFLAGVRSIMKEAKEDLLNKV
jgi:hypothetical protein